MKRIIIATPKNWPLAKRLRAIIDNHSESCENGCIEWTGPTYLKNRFGYGQFSLSGKTWFTHRAAWFIVNGEIPKGMYVCHHCDNGRCVNIDHLFLGTPADNTHDMFTKGRNSTFRPGRPPEIAVSIVSAIVAMYQNTRLSQRAIAEKFNISKGTVHYFVRGKVRGLSDSKSTNPDFHTLLLQMDRDDAIVYAYNNSRMTLSAMGDLLGLTRERVRQIVARKKAYASKTALPAIRPYTKRPEVRP